MNNSSMNCTNSTMMKGMQSKVALVAGGAGGIGSVVSMMLAKQGAIVVVADINEERAAKVVMNLPTESGAKHMATKMDVTSSADLQAVLEKIQKTYGKTVELAVDSAGWMEGESLLMNMKEEDWDHTIAVHLKGTFLLMQAVAKSMMNAKKPGAIVKIGSTLSKISYDEWGHLGAAEAGSMHLVHVAAKEWAKHGIRVNSVMPGLVDTPAITRFKGTDMWKKVEENAVQNRVGKPEDVAEAVSFLLSDGASYITGTELAVSGKTSV